MNKIMPPEGASINRTALIVSMIICVITIILVIVAWISKYNMPGENGFLTLLAIVFASLTIIAGSIAFSLQAVEKMLRKGNKKKTMW